MLVELEWKRVSSGVFMGDDPEIQAEMRRVFYAGAAGMFNIYRAIEAELNEAEKTKVIECLKAELIAGLYPGYKRIS